MADELYTILGLANETIKDNSLDYSVKINDSLSVDVKGSGYLITMNNLSLTNKYIDDCISTIGNYSKIINDYIIQYNSSTPGQKITLEENFSNVIPGMDKFPSNSVDQKQLLTDLRNYKSQLLVIKSEINNYYQSYSDGLIDLKKIVDIIEKTIQLNNGDIF